MRLLQRLLARYRQQKVPRIDASADQYVRTDTRGDLRADAGDDERALLRADHGHLRADVGAIGHGRAELYRSSGSPKYTSD